MRIIKYALLGIMATLAVAQAQGYTQSRLTTYDIRQLSVRPGVVYISPKYLTVVEFGDLIDEVGTSAPDLIKVTVSSTESMLILQGLRPKGSADLVVRVGGYIAMFRVVVDSESSLPRRYVVTLPQVPSSFGNTPRPNPPSQSESAPPMGVAGGEEAPATTATPTSPAPTPAPAAVTRTPSPAPASPVRYTFTPTRSPTGGLVVYYSVTNTTSTPLELKTTNLTVTKGSTTLPVRVVRTTYGASPDVVAPGETAGGAIIVPDASDGITLEWKAALGDQTYTLRQTVE